MSDYCVLCIIAPSDDDDDDDELRFEQCWIFFKVVFFMYFTFFIVF